MAKIYPQTPSTSSPSSSPYVSLNSECFTIWMKSLVYNSHGCTVYNSNGDIVYRVDNYDNKRSREVFLMDIRGNVLFSIHQKKLQLFGHWDGYKWDNCISDKKPWFRVTKKSRKIQVKLGGDKKYEIVKMSGKLGFKIVDGDEEDALVAEIKPKQTKMGINLGDDVFTLMVEPHIDQSLIMAIVMVYGLINHQI